MSNVYDFNAFKFRKRLKEIHAKIDLRDSIEKILADMVHNDRGQVDLNYEALIDDEDED